MTHAASERPLGLHQLSATDLSPVELCEVAAGAGYAAVSLFTNCPIVPIAGQGARFRFPTVTSENKDTVLERLHRHRLRVLNAEFFLLTPDVDIAGYAPGLALARELGAVNAITHVFDAEPSRAVATLARFCDLAGEYALNVSIEFCQMTPGCRSMAEAIRLVDRAARPNLGFGLCPMHFVRSGGTVADLQALDPSYLLFGQINDGHGMHQAAAYFEEVHDRALPGEGDFPLCDMIAALPAGLPLEVKIPCDSRIARGITARDYVRAAADRSRSVVRAAAVR